MSEPVVTGPYGVGRGRFFFLCTSVSHACIPWAVRELEKTCFARPWTMSHHIRVCGRGEMFVVLVRVSCPVVHVHTEYPRLIRWRIVSRLLSGLIVKNAVPLIASAFSGTCANASI